MADAGNDRPPDYASAFAADVTEADTLSAELWARTVLEGAPGPLRWFVLVGWKYVLLLRLAPRATAGTIAGWTVVGSPKPGSITLEVRSRLVTAQKVMKVDPDRVTLTTNVWYESALGRVVWSTLAPVHHRIEPLLITSAASRARRQA